MSFFDSVPNEGDVYDLKLTLLEDEKQSRTKKIEGLLDRLKKKEKN